MRYWFLKIGIRNGEYTYNSISLHQTEKEDFDSDDYVSDFYGEGEKDGKEYYFHAGCVACWVQRCDEITEDEYKVLDKIL